MRVEMQPYEVRQLVIEKLQELGAAAPVLFDLEENVLINGGRYIGRSYRGGDLMAMWLADLGIVQFYDADGRMLARVNLFERLSPQRMAA